MRSAVRRNSILASIAGLLLVVACAPEADVNTVSAKPNAATPTSPSVPGTLPPGSTAAPASSVPGVELTDKIIQPEIYQSVDYNSVVVTDGTKPPQPQDELVAISIADIQRWWGEQYPLVFGEEFVPLKGGIFAGYPGNTVDIPSCDEGAETTDYKAIQEYIAFYCNAGDFIAFDDGDGPDSFLVPLGKEFGSSVFGVVLAHEYGHAIQDRAGVFDRELPTIYTEQQADCYAGAWVGQSYNGKSPLIRLGDSDVRSSLLALLAVRDPVGVSQLADGGHGSAFDRVGAFEEGFLKGPARCTELIDAPLELIPNEFFAGGNSDLEQYSEGNAPFACSDLDRSKMINDGFDPKRADEIIANCIPGPEFLQDSLNGYWKLALDPNFPTLRADAVDDLDSYACQDTVRLNAYVLLCPSQQTIAYAGEDVHKLYTEFGDFTLGYLYGIAWAEQAQIYQASKLTGEPRALLNDCYTGAWVREITPRPGGSAPTATDANGDGIPDDTITSSPGDLDEATRTVIITGDIGANVNEIGTAFEKIAALREGALDGYPACAAKLQTG